MKLFVLTLISAALVLASGTTTPKKSGACAISVLEGVVSKVDAGAKTLAVKGAKASRDFKVADDTIFRIPGATAQQLKEAPLSKVAPNARVKVFFCAQDGRPVEVKVER